MSSDWPENGTRAKPLDLDAIRARAEAMLERSRGFTHGGCSDPLCFDVDHSRTMIGNDVLALLDKIERLREALSVADTEASVAHDAIWSTEVRGAGGSGFDILHSNDRSDSAQAAIWRLHEVARAALAAQESAK